MSELMAVIEEVNLPLPLMEKTNIEFPPLLWERGGRRPG